MPFVGRTAERDAIRAALRDSQGILVAGETGSGRTRLLTEALAAFHDRQWTVRRVTGIGTEVPFAAFAHLLPHTLARPPAPGAAAGPGNPLGRAAGAVVGDAPLVLAVDDAHLLDPWSAALVAYLVRHHGARAAVTAPAGGVIPWPIASLWKDGLLSRLVLEPLSLADSTRLVAALLDGPVEGLTARRLWHATRGNVGYLVEIVSSGGFEMVGGRWRQEQLVIGEPLREAVRTRMGELDPVEREVLELVAVGGPLDLARLVALTSPEAVERVEARGLITVRADVDGPRVRLAHTLYAHVVRGWLGLLGQRNRIGRIARDGTPHGTGGDGLSVREREVAQLASWHLTNKEIAGWLALSPRTVANHLCHVYAKLGVNDRAELGPLLV
ncbi:LuxR C-terminal-related transcriptional regulator [Nonomuraea sp. NBC_00507]|uniref:LuxR C-terminal-related transcriptional regulator n=1 Tax=Nonomuraea sp. NBC_00507 TaxID=2976002 RepID=UPI002E181EE1